MVCPQCKAKTKAGAQCKRKTCKFAPKCHSHTSVQVAPSSVAGRGLFAKKNISKGEIVADFTHAAVISQAELMRMRAQGTATHVAQVGAKLYNASNPNKTVAGMANRAPKGQRNTLQLTKTGKVRASQNVKAGSELFLAYGPGYRL